MPRHNGCPVKSGVEVPRRTPALTGKLRYNPGEHNTGIADKAIPVFFVRAQPVWIDRVLNDFGSAP